MIEIVYCFNGIDVSVFGVFGNDEEMFFYFFVELFCVGLLGKIVEDYDGIMVW